MATIREQIIAAFAARYGPSTIRGSVATAFEDVALGTVTGVLDDDDEVGGTEHGSVTLQMQLRVEQLEQYDSGTYGNHSTQANAMLGSLISTATSTDRTLGGLCSGIRYAEGGIDLASVSSDVVGAFAIFDVLYKFDIGDPNTDSYFV